MVDGCGCMRFEHKTKNAIYLSVQTIEYGANLLLIGYSSDD